VSVLLLGTACSSSSDGSPSGAGSDSSRVPIVTPSSAYGSLTYENDAQRQTYRTFLTCAADHGVDYEGPFQDSTGEGVFMRLAPGEHVSRAEQQRVNRECPELDVA
jgi:hypothetical protein